MDPESTDRTPATLDVDPEAEPTPRERTAARIEKRLDPIMAVLSVLWGVFVAYELIAPTHQRDTLRLVGDIVWAIFLVEFAVRLIVSGKPLRFLRRRWLSVIFLVVPILRTVRVLASLRALRVLPAARIVGSSYRTIGTARTLLGGRLSFLAVTTFAVIFGGGQLLFLLESTGRDDITLADTLWWSANLAISGAYVFEPESVLGRLVGLAISAYAIVVFASLAATIGAFFIEQRAEQAATEDAATA